MEKSKKVWGNVKYSRIKSSEKVYEFGETLTVKVVEECGNAVAMDWLFHFAKVQTEDGNIVKMTFPERMPRKGDLIQGRVGHSVFAIDGDKKPSPLGLHPAGGSNWGGMSLLNCVEKIPEPSRKGLVRGLAMSLLQALNR